MSMAVTKPGAMRRVFFFVSFLNWRIIALQCCDGFCHTSTWFSHRYIYAPPSWTSLPLPIPSHPSRLSQSTRFSSLCHTANSHWLSILHMVMYMFQCYSLYSSHPLLPSIMSTSLFSMSVERKGFWEKYLSPLQASRDGERKLTLPKHLTMFQVLCWLFRI